MESVSPLKNSGADLIEIENEGPDNLMRWYRRWREVPEGQCTCDKVALDDKWKIAVNAAKRKLLWEEDEDEEIPVGMDAVGLEMQRSTWGNRWK